MYQKKNMVFLWAFDTCDTFDTFDTFICDLR